MNKKLMSPRVLAVVMVLAIGCLSAPVWGAPFWVMFTPGVILGLAATWAVSRQAVSAVHSRHWPHVEGRVLSSRARRRLRFGDATEGQENTEAVITYEYTVDGKRYHNSGAGFCDPAGSNPDEARSFAAQYPAGRKVAVYYDSGNPAVSVLIPGQIGKALWAFMAVVALTLVCLGAGVLIWKLDR